MERNQLQAIAKELAKTVKTEADLNRLSQELLKMTVEAALNAELDDHLGYSKHAKTPEVGSSGNGYIRKTLKSQHGEVEIQTPRDRAGSFEPLLVKKNQRGALLPKIKGSDSIDFPYNGGGALSISWSCQQVATCSATKKPDVFRFFFAVLSCFNICMLYV